MVRNKLYALMSIGLLATLSSLCFPYAQSFLFEREQNSAKDTLGLVVSGIDQAIARYKPLPQLVVDDPALKELLLQSENEGLRPFTNEKLRLLALSLDVSDIYLKDVTGLTIATSNYRQETSFLGKNFQYRPYFQDALAGEAAFFHALGTTSGERGFFFAAPVLDGIKVIGVLTIKVAVTEIEAAWIGSERQILVTDPNGIVFLASNDLYRLRPLAPLADGQRQQIEETRQYPVRNLDPVPLSTSVLSNGVVEVTLNSGVGSNSYLSVSRPFALGGWHAIVLTPLRPIRLQAIYVVGVIATFVTSIGLAVLLVLQRRARLLDRVRIEQEQRNLLEVKVQERTADLDAANESLRVEITERRRTEDRLRQSQKDLVQAGKLAALGKMSAALSHEINQPLAAVKSYADNAREFLHRGLVKDAGHNITLISEMADRMAQISKHLRGFARQPGDKLKAVAIGNCVQQAIDLTAPQMRDHKVAVVFNKPDPDLYGIGGELRLQQVIVNLLNNAADAMDKATDKRIEIALHQDADEVLINVRDNGPGLDPNAMEQVFDAFYTTKEAGAGMGLGLSISYNIVEDFGGILTVQNHDQGGAIFSVRLTRAGVN